jgi:hypothetical protein
LNMLPLPLLCMSPFIPMIHMFYWFPRGLTCSICIFLAFFAHVFSCWYSISLVLLY